MPGSSPEDTAAIEADPAGTAGVTESSQQDVKTAESSTAENQGKSLFDSVTEALQRKESSPDSAQDPKADSAVPAEGTIEAKAEVKPEEPLGDLTDDELKRYGPKTQKRIKQLLAQRDEAIETNTGLKSKADNFDKIDEYIRVNRISNDDLAVVYELAALIKNDPVKAYERLTPIYNSLATMTGNVLPEDLREQARLGYITEAHAQELARLRSKAALSDNRLKEVTSRDAEDQQARAFEGQRGMCRDASNEWETAKKRSDPDWHLKQERIGELIELSLHKSGFPPTKAKVVDMLDGILKKVNTELTRFAPKLKAITPDVGTASTRANAEPKTVKDAVMEALGTRS